MEELNNRKRKLTNLIVVGVVLIIFGIIMMFIILNPESEGGIYISLILGCLPGGGLIYYALKKIKVISNEFKNEFVRKEIESRIPNAVFSVNEGISKDVVGQSNLITLHEIYQTEDLITGKINDVQFRSADVTVKDVRKSGKHTTIVTTFKGRFYEFDFPKQFKSNVFLLQPGQFRPFSGMRKIKMESIQFNSEFKIYTNDDHDAFYLLTPHLMEKLLKLDSKYYDKIGFSFLNSKLYIAIDSRIDTFDVSIFGDISNGDIDKAIIEIENMIEFVEYLQLDSELFKG